MSDPTKQFRNEVAANIASLGQDAELHSKTLDWIRHSALHKYSYNSSWLGRPIIQYPQDMLAMQELIWSVRPDLVIETGIAHGGSLILSASMLALLDMTDAIEAGTTLDPAAPKRKVLGIDVDIRAHNRSAIEAHPMSNRIEMIEASSIAPETVDQVRSIADKHERVMVFLDSNHTHDHVLEELKAYAPLTSEGSYCVVFDTIIEDLPEDMFPDRPWGPDNNPKTAVWEYLKSHSEFQIDSSIPNKLQITVAPDGYLKRVS